MSFASGPITFRRYFIEGPFARVVDDGMVRVLNDHAFGRHGTATPDRSEIGWVSGEHAFDTRFTPDKIAYDRFAYFMIRVDKTSPPPAILQSYVRQEELAETDQAESDASGRQVLGGPARKRARERAIIRAQEEAKKGLYRRIATYPALIDLPRRTVYLGNTGSAVGDRFLELFRDSFGASLEPADSALVAHRIAAAAGDARAIEDAAPFHLIPPPQVEAAEADWSRNRLFFGREFLTWLWFKTDHDDEAFESRRGEVSARITDALHLECDFHLTGRDTLRCDKPTSAPEARAALAIGKQPTRAGLLLQGPAGHYGLTFDAARFAISGLRVPDVEPGEQGASSGEDGGAPRNDAVHPRIRLEQRFGHMTEAAGLLDTLFGLFLGRRAAGDWPTELDAMRRWGGGRSVSAPTRNVVTSPASR